MKQRMTAAVLILVLATSAFGGDNFSDALTKGTFKGQATFLYLTGSDTDVVAARGSDDKDTGSVGVNAEYLTGDFYGFRLGAGIQAGYDMGFHDEDGSIEDDTRNSVTAIGIHQAYLSYAFENAAVKVGRQFIKSPLLMNSTAFPLKDSFDAVQFKTDVFPKTVIKAYFINRWNKRYGTDSNGGIAQEDVDFSDPLLSFYVQNQGIDGLTLDAQYMTTNEDTNNGDLPVVTKGGYDQYFARADYKFSTALPLSLGAEIGGASFDLASKDDAFFYGIKLGTRLWGANLSAAYTCVDDDADYPGTMGHVPDVVLYTNGLLNKSIYAGVNAISLQAVHSFGIKDFKARLKLIHLDQSEEGMARSAKQINGANEVNLDLNYAFSGMFKGLSTRLFMGWADYDQDVEDDTNLYARFYLIYKF